LADVRQRARRDDPRLVAAQVEQTVVDVERGIERHLVADHLDQAERVLDVRREQAFLRDRDRELEAAAYRRRQGLRGDWRFHPASPRGAPGQSQPSIAAWWGNFRSACASRRTRGAAPAGAATSRAPPQAGRRADQPTRARAAASWASTAARAVPPGTARSSTES